MTNFYVSINRILAVMKNLVNRVRLASLSSKFGPTLATLICLCMLTIGVGNAWGAEGDTHDFSQSLSQLLNNNASIASINIAAQSYAVKEVKVTWNYNKATTNAVTIEVSVGKTSFGSTTVGTSTTATTSFKTSPQTSVGGAISVSFTNLTGSGTGHGTFKVTNIQLVEGAAAGPCTVTFTKTDGSTQAITEASTGAGVTPPSMDTPCNGWAFQGWSETESDDEENTDELELVTLTAGKYYPSSNVTLYPVYTKTIEGSPVETKSQTFQYDTWTKGGSSTDKSSYRLFHNGGYVESASDVDFSKLTKVIVYGGTYGGASNDGISIKKADGTVWKDATVSGSSQTGANTITGGTSLTGSAKLRVYSTSGTASGSGVRISKVEVFTMENGTTTYYYSYPSCAACDDDPTVGTAQLNGAFSLSSVGVTCPTTGTSVGTNCSWTDYGFVWGTSNSSGRPNLTSDSGNKEQVGTSGSTTTWVGALTGTFSTGTTYYYRAYGKNAKDGAAFVYGNVSSFKLQKVVFNANGGTGTMSDQAVLYNTATALTSNSFTRDGFGFEGWATSSDGDVVYADGANITLTADQTLYAKWGALKYDVTYNAGANGTGSVEGQKKTHDVELTLSSETFTREGYTQDGWSTTDGGSKDYELGGSYTANAAITLYPHWTINNYTVSWSVNGSSWSSGVTDANNNANYGSTVSAPTAPTSSDCDDSKVFVGWTNAEYSNPSSAPGVLFTSTSPAITANTTFYAVFATSSSGGATSSTSITSYEDGVYYMVDTRDEVSGGYFALNGAPSEGAISVTDIRSAVTNNGTTITLDLTNAAIVDAMKYRLTTVGDSITITHVGTSTTISQKVNDTKFETTGKRNWTITKHGTNNRFTIQSWFTNSGDKTSCLLMQYSNWNGSSQVLTLVARPFNSVNMGGTAPKAQNYMSGYVYLIPADNITYSDYATTCCQQPATQLEIAADKTELVRSGAVNFTLTGGNGQDITWSCRDEADENCDALLSNTSNSGATLTISSPVAATKTYTVKAVQPEDDDDAEVVCGKTVTMDITVKAQWTITFKTTDDSSLSTYSTETVTDGDTYTFPDLSDEYTCETNYSFVGWRATNTAGAPEYAGGSSATASEDKTWYAVWMYSTGTTIVTRDKYELVTSSSTAIAEDDVVVIACNTQGVALAQMSTSDTYGSPVAVDFATDKSYLTFASGTNVMELKVLYYDSEGSWYFQDNASSSYYINYTENATLTYKSSFWTWTITPDASGNANIVDYVAPSYKLQYRKETSRFAFYTGSNKDVQLYRKNGTVSVEVPATPTYYVNNEHCTNGATIRAAEGQWVTSAKDQKVRITVPVTAKNFEASGKQMSATSDNSHFSVSIPSHTIPSDKSEVEVQMTVEYTPAEANVIEEANITITTGTGDGDATKVISVNGRSLPDEFVIVTQKEGKWQALPADMFSGTGTYSPIEVTPNGGITAIPAAPYTTIYSAREVASGRYETAGTCVRLVGNNNKCLWANSSSNGTGIQNFAALGNTNGSQYEWLLSTADGEQYTIANPAHSDYETGRQLGIYTLKYGLYKTTDIFYLLPVGCSSQPGNLQITPRRVDAMFSWETNAASVTIDLWTNEAMSEGHKQAVVTSVPYQFTGLTENTDYWYKITPGSDDDCALTGSFSTTGPTIELVEWGENSATIFVDKDEAVDPQIIIAGEVEHGQGGTAATDIFFSKYFEAQEKAKLLAIYNGTGNAISLADITIVQRANATALSLAKYGKTPGFIQPGEEIILYYPSSISAIMDCAEKEESFSTWNNVSDETGSSNLDFGGKGTIRMFRGSKCIDIIGAMSSTATAGDMNSASVKPIDGSGYPSFGDDNGFVSTSGDNYKTDEEENNYELSTNRCLLIRKPHVVSGDSAVLNNFGDFKTLGTYTGVDSKTHKGEWAGLQIPTGPTGDKYHYTCEGFKDVGVFDYNKYYREYTQIGDDKYLSDFTRAADGTYTLPIAYMRQYACLNLKFQLTEHNNKANVLTEQTVQVPIVVKDARNSNDTLFNNIIKADEAPHTPMVPQSIERCKTCNVVVLSTGTLTKATDGATNDVAELRDVKVYPGGKLIVPEGTHYVINSLSLRRQEDEIASAKVDAGLSSDPSDVSAKGLYIRESNGVYLDVRIDPSNWHYFTLPYDCRVGDIRFSDGTPAKVNNDYLISWYDGAYRAEHKDGGWTDITDEDYVLKKGLGYIVALPGDGLIKRELRFPMANEVISAELANKVVGGLYAYGGDKTDEELRPNHKGWNMIGNPYLYDYTTADIVNTPLATGELVHDPSSPWNGQWVRTGSARYIVEPIDNGWTGYRQTTISNLKPFTSYFIQVGTKTDGTDNPETERNITFNKTSKASIARRNMPAEEAEEPMYPVWYGIEMTAPNAEKDNTTLLISDEFTDGYDMMDDLIKMRGSYYQYYPYPVLASRNNEGEMAFNALPDSSAAVIGVPLNYYAAQAGTYTIRTDSRFDLEEVKSAMLYDATTNQYNDLLAGDYSFTTAKGDNTNRFKLFVRVERKKTPAIATGTDNILENGKLSLIVIDRTLVLSGLDEAADIYVYDMSGKLIKGERNAGEGVWRANVPAQGVYFVRINSQSGQQTLRTIVK